ncbi:MULTISPECIES: recombinase family protein [Geobacillus]|uniref:Site-specific recombinase, resolvase family, putative n=2 Tax=Geobacillus thermodenitrificans TaxID=33940 RepID=A4IKG2_GEOTN|nr:MULTISPECIES: recombinase family protein [Geobacillus]ABO65816.1 Site-specific recombinase, resolvase family, putative [Geobacillus thermodenitrificans NG80-2]ARA97741.1 recombinase family protein [Geobacillus thermodenitrificans]ATO37077.1 recombinase family protein [Geobacillus thermodenitrificans]MED3719024.1 recombinase family protein [Geobacillus thermodenitrificans]OQP07695.1 recombinase family protein [Geobacillus sp. 47C-IIb]
MNVVGYIRVSTQGQARDGYSLKYQEEEIKAYCEKNGWNLIHIFRDEGISGAKMNEEAFEVDRVGLQEMLAHLSSLQIKYGVVLNTSRLWRSDMVRVLIHRELQKYGVDIKSIEQPSYSIYKKDPSDVLVNGLMELLDQYQRLEIALKLKKGQHKKAKEGGYAGGRVIFGYTKPKGEKELKVHHEQAKVVKRVFELKRKHPQGSLAHIARVLNDEGYKTAQGKPFTKVQVKRILDRKSFYQGMYTYGPIQAHGKHEAILSNVT